MTAATRAQINEIASQLLGKPVTVFGQDQGGYAYIPESRVGIQRDFYRSLLGPRQKYNPAALFMLAHELGHFARGVAPGVPNQTGGIDATPESIALTEKWANQWAWNNFLKMAGMFGFNPQQAKQMRLKGRNALRNTAQNF